MRTATYALALVGIALILGAGCASTGKAQKAPGKAERPGRAAYTAENNPTTRAGRGEPSLDEHFKSAAWILVDGLEGRFIEEDGRPQLQWVIDGPVSRSPTFRVEAYQPLLGTPREFKSVLRTIESVDGSELVYGIAAKEGEFKVGHDYSLLQPGDDFIIRNSATGDLVSEIAPLAPGRYLLAGGIRNNETGAETPAVTFFTVGK